MLGFPLRFEGDRRLDFIHEGCDLIAFKCERNAVVEAYIQVAPSVFVFEVPSVDETMDDLRSRGVRFLHEHPAENELGRYAAFVDPFGNVHEIYEARMQVND